MPSQLYKMVTKIVHRTYKRYFLFYDPFRLILESPNKWISVYGEQSDYREESQLVLKNSTMEFSTMRVGIFAFLIMKTCIERSILVCLKPIDIPANDTLFLRVYVVPSQEKQVSIFKEVLHP